MQTLESFVVVGGGKMGLQYARKLSEGGYSVAVLDTSEGARKNASSYGLATASTVAEAMEFFQGEQATFMLSLGHKIVGTWLNESLPYIPSGSVIIDGGNTDPRETEKHTDIVKSAGSTLVNAGISGGVLGYESGFTVMLGGDKETVNAFVPALRVLTAPNGAYFYSDAVDVNGHLTKTIHNGGLYGGLQKVAEVVYAFKKANPEADLADALSAIKDGPAGHTYDIVQGRLEGTISLVETGEWSFPYYSPLREFHDRVYDAMMQVTTEVAEMLKAAAPGINVPEALSVIKRGVAGRVLEIFEAVLSDNPNLEGTDGRVDANGTGLWAYEIAQSLNVETPALEKALQVRNDSQSGTVGFVTKLIALARGYFGNHPVHPAKG